MYASNVTFVLNQQKKSSQIQLPSVSINVACTGLDGLLFAVTISNGSPNILVTVPHAKDVLNTKLIRNWHNSVSYAIWI